jgi:hypothetical protein
VISKGWTLVEQPTGHRMPGNLPSPAPAGPPRGPWHAARFASVVLILWAIIGVFRATFAVGHYEERITVVNHGNVDVVPAWLAYILLDHLMPWGMANAMVDRSWIFGSLVAAAAVATWLWLARRHVERYGGTLAWAPGWALGGWLIPVANLVIPYLVARDVQRGSGPVAQSAPVGWWWVCVLATVLIHWLAWPFDMLNSYSGPLYRTALDTRLIAYPLWTAGAVMTVVAAFLSARVMRRITEAQRRAAEAAATSPA